RSGTESSRIRSSSKSMPSKIWDPSNATSFNTCLKLSGLQLGLSIHFHVDLLKDGIVRVVNGLPI
ncbi:MAG TPA: hypothetical protein VL132_02355, partial [Planctomycetaceae bacterium]|nr:hypothetical protein [Planctomycetaceae bacterium]